MKQQTFRWLFAILALCLLYPVRTASAQTDYSVPVTFSVTSTGINRFIASQWSSITNSWSGPYQGLTYSFQLKRPTISLTANTIKIQLGLTISSSVYNGSVTLTPTLTIPSTTISATNIIAQYMDLHNQIINTPALVDARLQYVIEQALAPINWIVYQGKALNESTSRLTEDANISWYGLPTLTFAVANNEVDITITPTLRANDPSYTFQWNRTSNRTFRVKVHSNNMVRIRWVKMYNIDGQEIYNSFVDVPATYDAANGDYVATATGTASSDIANNFNELYFQVVLRRGGTEILWSLGTRSPVFGYPYDWTWFPYTGMTLVRGE